MLNMNFWFFAMVILVWLAAFALGAFAGVELQKQEAEEDNSDMLEFWKESSEQWKDMYEKENEEKGMWHQKYLDLKYKNE